jgi:hypothetical protein
MLGSCLVLLLGTRLVFLGCCLGAEPSFSPSSAEPVLGSDNNDFLGLGLGLGLVITEPQECL